MAHGENAQKNGRRGKEYWKSRLHRFGEEPGRWTKTQTHRKERRITNDEIQKNLQESGEGEGKCT